MRRIVTALVLMSILALTGCAGKSITPDQVKAIEVGAGVLQALCTVPLPPGVDPATAAQINGWRAWGAEVVPALEGVAKGTANPTSASPSPVAEPSSSSKVTE